MEIQDVAVYEKGGNAGRTPAHWCESTDLWWKTTDIGPSNLVQFQTPFSTADTAGLRALKSVMSVLFACVLIIL